MKKTITFLSTRAAMILLATLLLTLTVQPAWADDPLSLPAPDGEGNVTITTPGTYTASGHIYGNLIINTNGLVILNVDDLTLDSDDDSNNYDRDIRLENGTLTLNVSNDKSLKARDIFTTTLTMTGGTISAYNVDANALTMTGGTISAYNVGANTIDMSAGLIEANSFDAGGTISGGTITVQNFYAGHNTGQDYIKLTISGGTITANGTFYIFDLEINASTLGLSITANTYNYVYGDSNLSITNGYVTDGTYIYGSGDTYSESLKRNLQGNGGTTLTVAVVYTVTFDKCGGEGGDDDALVMYDHDMPTINLPTRDGYAFGGYFTATNGNGTQYYNADGTSTRTWNIANNATLYAKWTVVPHIVTSEMKDWAAGTYNVTSNVTIDGPVTITGDVILNINSGCTLNIANGHIDAPQGSLTFNGPGTLSVADHIDANTFNMTGGILSVANDLYANTFNMTGGMINADMSITVGGTISGGTIETGSLYIASLVIDATNSHSISIKANEYKWAYSGGCSLTINGTLYAGNTELTGTFNNNNDLSVYNGKYLRTSSYSNTYTVTFNANGGSGTMSPQTFTVDEAQALSTCTFTRNDHTFDGWATTQGGDVAYTDGQSVTNLTSAGGTVTLYAHWTENAAPVTTYTVTFDGNGSTYGTMAAQTFTVGVAQNLSNCNFSRHGYTFDGWATTQDGNVEYSDGQEVTTDLASAGGTVTLYAHWTPNTYTVIFDKNGGSGNQMDNQAFTYDMAQELSECTYTKDGYTFDGWATADDGNVVYTDKQSVSNLTAVAGGTVTLYAHWAQDRIYTEGIYSLHDTNISGDIICKGNVTLEVDGELTVGDIRIEGEGSLTINVQDHSSITAGSIDANNLNMNGGTVTAGSINVDNFNMTGGTVSVGSLTASGGDISDGTLSITGDFHTWDNTISGGNITVGGELQINNELHLEANQATMSIYVKTYDLNAGSLTITSERGFSDGTTAYNGNSTIANPAALNGKTLKPAYKVTIEENGGSEVEDQFVAYGSTATEPNSTKTGYTATWYKGEDEYNFTAAVEDDFTLRAEWTPKTYTVILDRQGATTGSESVAATYDADMPAITIPTMLGYTFYGYFTETDGGGIQYYDADGTSTRPWDIDATTATTLYAKWEILRFEIGDVTYEWTDETNVKVTGYNGASASITILPSVEHNGVPYYVTEIGEEAFKDNNSLVSIDLLPEASHITVIGARAFKGCTNLSDNDNRCLPDKLTRIEEEAFSGCNLTEITIPETVTSIGEGAFSDCTSLTSVTLPASVPSWGGNPFVGCNENLIIYVPEHLVDTYRNLWPDANILAVGTIPYIAADGSKAYCEEYTELTGSSDEVTLGSDGQTTWYVVNSDVRYYDVINLVGNVNLILCDDMTMTAYGGSASAIKGDSPNNSLTIYGQTAGTGKLVAQTGEGCGICSNAITINGGTVDAHGTYNHSAIYADGNITINGGNVSAYGNQKGIEARGNIILGWTNITTDRISAQNYIVGGTISIANGKVFTDGTNVYNSATPSSTLAALTDVTLIPKKDFTKCKATVPNQIRQYDRMSYQFEAANYGYYSVGETIEDGETTLTLGQDYEFGSIEYADPNKTPSYAQYQGDYDQLGDELVVTINGKGDYSGTLYATFKIVVPDANGTMGDLKWVYSDGTLTISKKDDVEGNVAMPDGNNYDDFDWKEVASGVFTLTIDEGITKVGNFAFGSKDGVEHYGNLTTINLPNSLTEIGENAFAYCGGLTVNLDDILAKNIKLDNRAFYQIGCLTGSLANNANNDTKIALLDQARSNDVTLSDRTLYRDGYWNTLCLPFAVTVGSDVMADATAMTLNTSTSGFNESTGELTLNFDAVTSGNTIDAGTPFIVKWGNKDSHPDTDITDPVFSGVTISSTTPATDVISTDTKVSFIGNYDPVTLKANNKSNLYLGVKDGKNTLFWPSSDRQINAFRAYFHVDLSNPSGGGQAPELKIVLNFGEDENTTGIITMSDVRSKMSDVWYTLDGRKLDGKPTQKGLYIVNGKKVVIK